KPAAQQTWKSAQQKLICAQLTASDAIAGDPFEGTKKINGYNVKGRFGHFKSTLLKVRALALCFPQGGNYPLRHTAPIVGFPERLGPRKQTVRWAFQGEVHGGREAFEGII